MKESLLVALLLLLLIIPTAGAESHEKPLVVATIAPLASIVEDAFNGSVSVTYLIPPGADPHEYQLTTEQMELLKKADVIVTTGGHLPIERKIAELKDEGLFSGKVLLIDDYKREGFRYLKEHWYSDKDNPHGVWLDPTNALAIAKATESALEEADPARAEEYRSELECFEERVGAIVESYKALAPANAKALIEMPPDEYALEWLGIKAVASIKPEEEVPAKGVDELLPVAKNASLVVYGLESPEQLKKATLELASKTGKPVAEIRVFWSGEPYTKVLVENSASIIRALGGKERAPVRATSNVTQYVLVSLLTGLVLGTALGVVLKK